MRIIDWRSCVCSSDLDTDDAGASRTECACSVVGPVPQHACGLENFLAGRLGDACPIREGARDRRLRYSRELGDICRYGYSGLQSGRSEEHTSELQSLMRSSYAVFCLEKKKEM